MDLKLRGKRALVTGSTAGIGFAIARGLARERAEVIINGRTEDKVVEAVRRITSEIGSSATGIAADLSSAEGVNRLLERAGRIDILINNVGIFEPEPFLEISDQDWFRFFELNVMSGVRLSRALLPSMLRRNWGRIIFVSSESGVQIPAEMVHYGLTKTAQLALSRGIAESVAGTGVTANAVLPGPTRSDGVVDFLAKVAAEHNTDQAQVEAEFLRTMRPSSLIRRFAESDEVANLVVFLAGEGSSAITGAALRVDGGVVRSIV
ncbi:SDR family NAD(P)-dependent oxidoreductase [Methyloceanibacter sp.]|uniref:SDR family NAD(P)-dependent oxidoreductase n=1 Tax=Methyloceanibacter sp. TaxID=1965321 RepID=UPI002D4E94E3|nr:SDR family NAD(P)-dependent oxidoreductase [Methyloceanibacter sp.]HZP08947.1 SDR family NAD(P)-dependent oxidoreductase [Methyloceanibacter sp.]